MKSDVKLILALSLTVILSGAAGLFANGQQEGSAGGPVELEMTVWGSNFDPEVYQARLDIFESKNLDIKVKLNYIASEYSQVVQTMIAGGESPDIIQLAEDVHAYSSLGQIIPLNSYLEASGVDVEERWGAGGLVEAYSRDGNLYAFPDRGGMLLLYYNKDMFDAAGLEYPSGDWTWEDFLKAAQALTIREGDDVVQYGFAAGGWWPWWMSFVYQNGGRILDENGKPVVNSPETIEAIEFYNDLVFEYGVAPSPEDFANLGTGSPDPLHAQGIVAMITTGFWNVAGLQKVNDLNWDIAPMFGNREKAVAPFGSGFAISSDCKYPDEAFKVLEFLTSSEGQMPIVSMKQDLPTNLAVLKSDEFKNTEWSKTPISLDSIAVSAENLFPLPLVPEWNEMLDILNNNLAEVFMGLMEVEEGLNAAQEELEYLFE